MGAAHRELADPELGERHGNDENLELLAAKRPRLVPIFDSVVRDLFPPVSNYWAAFQYALSDDKFHIALAVTVNGEAPEGPTFLCKLDAMLWMIGRQAAR